MHTSVVALPLAESASGDTTPCRMTRMTLYSHVRYEEIQARTCCRPLFSSVKPYAHTMSMCVSSARAEPFRQTPAPLSTEVRTPQWSYMGVPLPKSGPLRAVHLSHY